MQAELGEERRSTAGLWQGLLASPSNTEQPLFLFCGSQHDELRVIATSSPQAVWTGMFALLCTPGTFVA